ncbi:MAG: hypothetical protein GWP03_02920, partial [Proteobacteria bacterium]|nr:hypothetical protein [Pseudomonadota bacterium]
ETFTGHYIKFLNKIPDTTFAGNMVDIFGQILYDSLNLSRIEVFYDSIPDSLKEKDSGFFYDSRDSYSYSGNVDFYLKTGEPQINLSNYHNTIDTTGNQFYGSIYTNRKGYYTIVPILSDGSNLFEGANKTFFAK